MKRLFVEADELGTWLQPHSIHERWQDHGMGLLLTLAAAQGQPFDVLSLKGLHSWAELRLRLKGYDLLAMNVRSWRFIYARRVAELFKQVNPQGQVWVGGMHATVAPQEMLDVAAFDVIVAREAERTWQKLLLDGAPAGERLLQGEGVKELDNLPWLNRALWPKTPDGNRWPLEDPGGWVPGPAVASVIVSRMCPLHCSFCYPAEKNHFYCGPRKRSVANLIGELEAIETRWGNFQSVLFHDSEFLMYPKWLAEFVNEWPRRVNKPFWASCRADMMLRWPELVWALRRDCKWHCFSIGLESGSQRVLDIMNKETTVAQNEAAIDLVNQMVDEAVAKGQRPPVIFANIMLAVPGETPEDAFATMKMLRRIKRVIPSIAWFTPYPGSTLGNQLIAEGRSLDAHKKYLRFPNEAKVAGVDYQFYVDLFQGRYDAEVGYSVPRLLAMQGQEGEAL